MTKPIGVATYTFTDALPKELSQNFPTSEQFIERVEKLAEAMNRKKWCPARQKAYRAVDSERVLLNGQYEQYEPQNNPG